MTDSVTTHWTADLERLSACREAVEWAKAYYSIEDAWQVCERGDWMLWLAGRVSGKPWSDSRRPLTAAAVECARLALPIYEQRHPGDARVRECLDLFARWAGGEAIARAELGRVRTAATAATSAAAADADDADDAATERALTLRSCADIVRSHYPHAPEITP